MLQVSILCRYQRITETRRQGERFISPFGEQKLDGDSLLLLVITDCRWSVLCSWTIRPQI